MESNARNVRGNGKEIVWLIVVCLLLAGCAKRTASRSEQPGVEETQESSLKIEQENKFENYPDEYFVKWAIPCGMLSVEVSEETITEINRKLEADGYEFGLKIVPVDDSNYLENIKKSNADIVSLGLDLSQERLAEVALKENLFECLDSRLEGSRLYDAIPELCWEAVRDQGNIYYIPNEILRDSGMALFVKKGQHPSDFPEQFPGDVLKLGNYLSEDCQLYYGGDLFDFAGIYGYAFDITKGLLIAEDGTCVNPLEEEWVVEWLRTMNQWYHDGKVQTDYSLMDQCSIAFLRNMQYQEKWQEYAAWKGYVFHRTNCSVGIMASSDKKEAAFKLLEVFHTDHSYGNLLIFGAEALETGNLGENNRFCRWIFGLDTGLKWKVEDLDYFSSSEEKKQYYDSYILPSPSLYLEFPEECNRLLEIEQKYMNNKALIICDDFDTMLQQFRDELKEPMDEVLKKLAEQ